MALLNRQLTEDEARQILTEWRRGIGAPVYKIFMDMWLERDTNQYIRYDATLNRVVLEDRETFYVPGPPSPSDCRMMVPK